MKHLFLTITILFAMNARAKETNFHFRHSDSTFASGDKIWQIWTDVPNWKKWDQGLKDAYIDGPFTIGQKGKLVPDRGPKSKFIISEIEPGKSYTFKTKIPFGWLIIRRFLEFEDGQTIFTHDVEFTGIFKKILGNKLGKKYKAMLPNVMHEIKMIAEAK